MTETEVERLVVRLIGDSSSFKKAFDDAAKATEEFKQATSELTKTEKLLEQQQQKIAQIMEQSKTSAQKYAEQIKELDALLNATTTAEERHAVSLRRSQVAQEAANAASGKSQQQYKDIGSSLATAGTAIATVGAIITGSLVMLGKSAVDQAKEFEQTMISFEAMLGSQVKAKTLLTELTKFSAETPFTMPTLLSATKMLLQFQVPARDVMGILKSIGDVTGGSDAGKVQAMAYAFSQMSAAGRLMGQDLMQMINAGFNPLTEMSKTTGKSLAVLREEMSEGKITADMVKAAFASASERLDLMGKQAVTLGGRMSTLDDNIGLFWRSIGEQLLPLVGYVVDAFASWVKRFQDLDPWWKSFIAYAGLAAAILGTFTTVIGGTIAGLGFMITALSNAVIAINGLLLPLGIAITGMGLLIAMLGLGIVVATAVVVVAIVETSAAVQALNAEMETSLKLASRLGHVFDRGTKAIISEADSKTSPQKEEFLQTNFDQATKNVQGTTAALEEMKTQTAALEPSWMSLWQSGRRLWEASQQQVKETEEHLENLKKRAAAVQDELIKMKGTGFIEESIKKSDKELASLAVNLRKLQKEHETMTEWDNPLFYLSDTDEVNAQLEKIKAAKKEIESVTKNKDHLGDLKVEMEFKLSVQAEKTLTDLKKKIKNAGLSEAEIAARDIETLAGTKTGEAKKADMKQATELRAVGEAAKIAERGGAAITTIKEANRVFEEQASLVGKVGFARKRAELEIQIAQGLAMEGAHDNAVMFEQNATRRRQLVEEETQHITDMINKREQGIAMIGKYGVELAKAKAMQEQGVTDPNDPNLKFDAGREQKNINAEFLANYNKELATTVALSGKYGAALEFAKMQQQGLTEGVTLAMVADKMNADTLSKTTVELTKQAEAIEAMGFDAFLIAKGFDKAGQSSATLNAMYKEYEKSKQNSVDGTIKKLHEEASLVGKTGFDAWKQQEKNKGNVYSNEQEASMKQAFDATDATKANEQFLPPVEKYEREMKKIEDMRKAGLSDPAYEQLVKKAQEEMYKAPSGPGARTIDFKSQMTEGLNANSAQAQRMIAITAMQRGYGNTGSIGASRAASVAGRGGRGGGGGGRGGVGGGGAVPVDPLTKVDSEKDSAQNMAASLKELVSLARLQLAKPAVEFMEAGLT